MENKPLILSLIKAELKATRLIHGLETAGLHPDDYYPDISKEVFRLMGFPDPETDDSLQDFYYTLLESKSQLPVKDFMDTLDDLAMEVYVKLLRAVNRNSKLSNRNSKQ